MDQPATLIIHHANCPDGFGSAWLLEQSHPGATIVAASYGDPLPEVDGLDVFLVDFCYEAEQLMELGLRCNSLTILDHHQTALGYVEAAGIEKFDSVQNYFERQEAVPQTFAILDMEHSGVGLVQQFTGYTVPFLSHVEDRDLWRFALPNTADVFAAVTSRPYTKEAWDRMDSMPLEDLIVEGKAISRYRDKLIQDAVATARQELLPTGHRVWVAASPYAIGSDVAGELAKRQPELFAAYYVDGPDGIRFGLRSTPVGLDVAKIAETLGGGGHKHASGFEVTRKWNGWT
jgi:oligoribonuclease NrnB/cAMP/cGMP phosphodiesterase (DHH superfamily)